MTDQSERRLYTIRNAAASVLRESKESPPIYEFEVFSEVPVDGEFIFGPFSLSAWDATPPTGSRRSLVLRFADFLDIKSPLVKSTKGGFYHGISMPDEFCALATALLRRRVLLGPLLRVNDGAIRVSSPSYPPNLDLVKGKIDLSQLASRLEELSRLPSEYHEAFILACRMYQEAVMVIDDKPDIAYLLLVSGVEVFVAKFVPRTSESELSEEIRQALGQCDPESRKVLLRRILELDRGISRNFVSFVNAHVTDDFWSQSPKISTEEGRVTREELPELLKRVYNQRSKTLHEAEPFPPNVLAPPNDYAEIDRRSEITVGERRWTQTQFVPYVRFFERLVQHVLVTFLKTRSNAPASETEV
jgi:hypothetical protein